MKNRKLIKLDLLRRKIHEHFISNPRSKSAIFKIESDMHKTHWKVTRSGVNSKNNKFNIVEVKSERNEFIIEQPIGQQQRAQQPAPAPMPQQRMPPPPPVAMQPNQLMSPFPTPPGPFPIQQQPQQIAAPMMTATQPSPNQLMSPFPTPPGPFPVQQQPPPPPAAPMAPQPPEMAPPMPAPQQEPVQPPADQQASADDLSNLPMISGDQNDWAPDSPGGRFGAEVYTKGLVGAQQSMPPEQLQQHFGIAHSALKGGTQPTGDPLDNPSIAPGDVKLDHNGMPASTIQEQPIAESSSAFATANQEFASLMVPPLNLSKVNTLKQKMIQTMGGFTAPEKTQAKFMIKWLTDLANPQTKPTSTQNTVPLSANKKNKGIVLREEGDTAFQPGTAEEMMLARTLKGQTVKDVSVVNNEGSIKIELKLASTKWPASFQMDKDGKLTYTFKDRSHMLHKKWN